MKKSIKEVKIVIIEDDQLKREDLVEILRDLGLKLSNINQSKYAEKGIEIIRDEWPDVVLLDLKIPYNKESESIKIDNSNKVIKAIEGLNAARNQVDSSTGIIIISASIKDEGLRKNYKHITEVVAFFTKDELDEENFKQELLKKIHQVVERDFRHVCKIELKEIRNIKLKKLEVIHKGLYNRISIDLLGQFQKLNNRRVNTYQIVENVISLSGRIVEDVICLIENKDAGLLPVDDSDNFNSVRNKLTALSGRKWCHDAKRYDLEGTPIISRKAAEYARLAYYFRSEALHTKEGDDDNKKIFNSGEYSIEDAAISINLIIPLIQDYVEFMSRK